VGYKCFIEFVSALNFKKIIIEDNITLQEYEACIKPLNIACEVYDMKQLRSIKTNEEIVLLQKSADIAVKTIE
jgi:Xaa-Pro aminopeptidase